METKNTLEIELFEANINSEIIEASYNVFDGDNEADVSNHQIQVATLIEWIEHNGYNAYCTDVLTGDYAAYPVREFLAENLNSLVKDYLTENLK